MARLLPRVHKADRYTASTKRLMITLSSQHPVKAPKFVDRSVDRVTANKSVNISKVLRDSYWAGHGTSIV